MHGIKVVFFQDYVELPDIRRQILNVYRGVFNNRYCFFVSGKVAQQPQTGFAQCPDLFCILPKQQWKVISQICGTHGSLGLCGNSGYFFLCIGRKFDYQDRTRVTLYKEPVFPLFNIVFGAFKYKMIDQFTGSRPELQCNEICS
jgi:hypothetical protein